MKCIKCGKTNPDGSRFCSFCGVKQELVCPNCGKVLEPGSLFCNMCGAKLGGTAGPVPAAAEKPVYENKSKASVSDEIKDFNIVHTDGEIALKACSVNDESLVFEAVHTDGETVLKEYSGNDENVIIPDGVTRIGTGAFMCKTLKSVVIPNSVTIIDSKAFWGCMFLESVTIPDSIICIGRYAFDSTALDEKTQKRINELKMRPLIRKGSSIPKNFNVENAVADGFKLIFDGESIQLLKYYGEKKDVKIPRGVTIILGVAFESAEITSVEIPYTVSEIGSKAFLNCTKLEKVVCSIWNKFEKIGKNAFYGCTSLNGYSRALIAHFKRIESFKKHFGKIECSYGIDPVGLKPSAEPYSGGIIKESCGDHVAGIYETPRTAAQLIRDKCISEYKTEKFGTINGFLFFQKHFYYIKDNCIYNSKNKLIKKYDKQVLCIKDDGKENVGVFFVELKYCGQRDEEWMQGDYGCTYDIYEIIISYEKMQ